MVQIDVLNGIPYGAKDLLAAKEYKTTWGATPYKDQKLDYDATVIKKLDELLNKKNSILDIHSVFCENKILDFLSKKRVNSFQESNHRSFSQEDK